MHEINDQARTVTRDDRLQQAITQQLPLLDAENGQAFGMFWQVLPGTLLVILDRYQLRGRVAHRCRSLAFDQFHRFPPIAAGIKHAIRVSIANEKIRIVAINVRRDHWLRLGTGVGLLDG